MDFDDVSVPPKAQIQADVDHLKDWISKESHLPNIEDEEWLKTFLYNNKFSLEKTKSKLTNYYSLRAKYPEIFRDRNPTGEDVLRVKKYYSNVLGHKPMKDGTRVVHFRYSGDPAEFDVMASLKSKFMFWDSMLLDPSNRLAYTIFILDFKNFKIPTILKLLSHMNVNGELLDKAYTTRTKAIHLINFPKWGEKFFQTIVDFLPMKLRERVHVHTSTKNTMFETVDEEVVCSDFGGKGLSLAELEELAQRNLEKYRKWFEEQDGICSNKLLRRNNSDEIEGLKGSFRKLEVD